MKNGLEYGAVMALRMLVTALPRSVSLRVGSTLGRLFYYFHGRRRELAVENLRAAFPSRTDVECRAILRSTFGHFGRHIVELLNFAEMNPSEMTRWLEVEGGERVEQALARGKGLMFYSGHFGYWELQVMGHAVFFRPIVMVARTLDNPLLERLIEKIRTRVGTQILPRQGAIRGLLQALLDKAPVALMIDQHMQDRSAVNVEFFDRPAATTSAVAALALRTGVPVIPVFALPLPGGRYRLVYEAPIEPPADDDPDPVRTYTQRCTDVLEMYVRRYPDLWLWMHRRWRPIGTDPSAPVLTKVETQCETVTREDRFS